MIFRYWYLTIWYLSTSDKLQEVAMDVQFNAVDFQKRDWF
jgi:hypothetical protein